MKGKKKNTEKTCLFKNKPKKYKLNKDKTRSKILN